MEKTIETLILTPDDCQSIIELLHKIYNDAYILNWMYDYTKLNQVILSGRYIFLGVKINKKLVSILTVSYPDPSRLVAEISTLIVDTLYRDFRNGEIVRKLIRFSRQFVNAQAKEKKISVLLARPVTKHTLSQKLQKILNMIPVGITYCTRPEENELQMKISSIENDFHSLNLTRHHQIVAIFCYSASFNRIKICLPSNDLAIVKKIFENTAILVQNNCELSQSSQCDINIKIEKHRSFVGLHLKQGCNMLEPLLKKIRFYIKEQFRIIHVFLNVGEFNHCDIINELHSFGFLFSYILPCYYGKNGHVLVLQYINQCPILDSSKNFLSKTMQSLHRELLGGVT